MSHDAWTFLGLCVTTLATSGVLHSKLRSRIDRVEKLAEPTGNGFAAEVKDALKSIEAKLDGHIGDHARADLQKK